MDVVYQVSDLISVINQTLDYAYPQVVVEGEVASFKVNKSKYVFFDIKDDTGVIGCFMMVYQLRIPLEDGMRVRIIARPQLTAWGKFSLTVREVMPVGEGSIKRAFEMLRAKLAAEGLFDPARKRALPRLPTQIGLVASTESAGYGDFIKLVGERWGGLHIEVADVQVQGLGAAAQISRAIEHFNQRAILPEVIVIVRGGGSAEDLAVFNDEDLVRTVAGSRAPTLVGVGHEVDVSLCDLAADVRAATPSNAAEILVPDRQALMAELTQREKRLYERIVRHAAQQRQKVDAAAAAMVRAMKSALVDAKKYVAQSEQVLHQLDPKVVLKRGYALVHDTKGQLVRDTKISVGDLLTVTTARAIIQAGVQHVETKE